MQMATDDVFQRLVGILVDQFGKAREQLTRDTTLRGGLMLDSLDLMDLSTCIGQEFGLTLDLHAVRSAQSLAGLARLVVERRRLAA